VEHRRLRRSRTSNLLGEIVFKISDNSTSSLHISGVAALSVRSACNAPVAFRGSRGRRYGSAVGPHWSLLKTFFSAIEQLHTSAFGVAEDYYRRHGSRRIGPHRSILKCQLRNCVSWDRFHISVSLKVFHWFTIDYHGWARSDRSILREWRKIGEKNEEVTDIFKRYLKVATWLLSRVSIRPDSTKLSKLSGLRSKHSYSMMEEVRGKEEVSSSNLRRLIWSIHIRKGRHRTFLTNVECQWKCRICLHTG